MTSSEPETVVTTTNLIPQSLRLIAQGKVRDLYYLDAKTLLFVATDKISAYDSPLLNGIPDKGCLLTRLTAHWIANLSHAIPTLRTHLVSTEVPKQIPAEAGRFLHGRCMVVRHLKMFPIEAIVRGYLTGSAWAEYKQSGTVHSMKLPEGLRESEALPGGPLYTPSTKAPPGSKDENISQAKAQELIGAEVASQIEALALQIYTFAAACARARGIIIADSKFEFGLDEDTGEVVLADEVLTPDSSRFWDAATYEVGRSQKSFDKQYLRDWLVQHDLKGRDQVRMPEDVVNETRKRYLSAFNLLVGDPL